MYVALCPDLDISQGTTIPEAKLNLREAIEVESRSHSEQYVSTVEAAFG
jgi:predicted RNase H-like HicB family nuclease